MTYAYPAENEDELTIEVGDIVEIVDKDSGQEGWWKVGPSSLYIIIRNLVCTDS